MLLASGWVGGSRAGCRAPTGCGTAGLGVGGTRDPAGGVAGCADPRTRCCTWRRTARRCGPADRRRPFVPAGRRRSEPSGAAVLGRRLAAWARRSGASTMIMLRPSSLGAASTLADGGRPARRRGRGSSCPSSGWLISRPRNMIVILTLWPSARNRERPGGSWCRSRPVPILGRYFISLMLVLVVLRRDSLARWASSNLNLP